jgi:hypothetical protein
MTRLSKINFFQPEIWQEGALEKEIQRNLAIPDDIKMEKRAGVARPNHDRYGRVEQIVKGDRSAASKTARYFGIVRQKLRQYAWEEGIHTGSINPSIRFTRIIRGSKFNGRLISTSYIMLRGDRAKSLLTRLIPTNTLPAVS